MGKLIRIDKIRPLDVILSKPRKHKSNISSDVIAFLTPEKGEFKSKYSHAAIAITPTIMFESVPDCINFRGVRPTKCVADKKRGLMLLKDVSDYDSIGVFRHTGLFHITPAEATKNQKKAFHSMFKYFLLQYPSINQLRSAFKNRNVRAKVANLVVGKLVEIYGKRQGKVASGPFCSQLICELFRDLRLELFKEPRSVDSPGVAPIDLLRSKLVRVEEAVIDEGEISTANDAKVFTELIEPVMQMFDEFQTLIEKSRQNNLLGTVNLFV